MTDRFHAILKTAVSIPPIPQALKQVMNLINKEDVTVGELAAAVSLDPSLAAKVLRLANSAYFGVVKPVDTVEKAAMVIGIDSIRSLALATGMMGLLQPAKGFDMRRFWTVSLLSAYVAKDIAQANQMDEQRAYTAALIHGLGVLAIHYVTPKIAQEINAHCLDVTPYERADMEWLALGYHHGEVGAELARIWELPQEIAESIRFYPHPLSGHKSLAGLLHISVAIAVDILGDIPPETWNQNIDDAVEELLNSTLQNIGELKPKFDRARQFVELLVTMH